MPYGTLAADIVQSSTAGTAPQFNDGNGTQTGTLCRAWVNFNATGSSGSATINASFNTSSVTVNALGDFTINFTNAFSDTNYCMIQGIQEVSTGNWGQMVVGKAGGTKTTTAYGVETKVGGNATLQNTCNNAFVAFFR